jgi:hypothetical protein
LLKSDQWRNYRRKKLRYQCFYGKNFTTIFLCSKRNYLEGSQTIFEKIDFLRKRLPTYAFIWGNFSLSSDLPNTAISKAFHTITKEYYWDKNKYYYLISNIKNLNKN